MRAGAGARWRSLLWSLAALALLGPALPASEPRQGTGQQTRQQTGHGTEAPPRVFLVTAAAGFVHSSIPTARDVVQRLARETGAFSVDLLPEVADLARLSAETLAGYDVVVFANTSGELPLDDTQKRALLDFVAGGGGFLGIHSAADTLYTWPEYARLLGGAFKEHPWTQLATLVVEDPDSALTQGLGQAFALEDEIYVFRKNPRTQAQVVLRLDAASVGAEGDFPLAWCSTYGAGRVYYNALGHFESTWNDDRFQVLLLNAIRWAAARLPGTCAPVGETTEREHGTPMRPGRSSL